MNFKRLMNWALRRNEKEASDSSPSRPYYLSDNAHPRDQRADAFISEFFKRPDLVTNQQILNKASLSYKSRILEVPRVGVLSGVQENVGDSLVCSCH